MGEEYHTTLREEVLRKFHADIFVETGTFHGEAVRMAIDEGFSEIYSIETDQELFNECVEKFRDDTRVSIFLGDSLDFLSGIAYSISDRSVFWLDAHAGNSPTAGRLEAPLLEELRILQKAPRRDHILLIDDVRLMGTNFWSEVTKIRVIDEILKINPLYVVDYEDSRGYKRDIMVAHIPDSEDDDYDE